MTRLLVRLEQLVLAVPPESEKTFALDLDALELRDLLRELPAYDALNLAIAVPEDLADSGVHSTTPQNEGCASA